MVLSMAGGFFVLSRVWRRGHLPFLYIFCCWPQGICAFIRMAGIVRGSVGGACINNFTLYPLPYCETGRGPQPDPTSQRIHVPVFAMIPVHLADVVEAGVAHIRCKPRSGCRAAWLGGTAGPVPKVHCHERALCFKSTFFFSLPITASISPY